MLNLSDLQYLVAFGDLGTLTKVSEYYHISTPTITRAMQNIEDELNVSLFIRSKNKIELNDTGRKAVEHARSLLQSAQSMISDIRTFDQQLRTITVKSCAPMPLWDIIPKLSSSYPNMTISSVICQTNEVLSSIRDGSCDIGIIPYRIEEPGIKVTYFESESLYVCIKKEHDLSKRKTVSFSDINGFNFLLRTQLGFWDTLCREKMPASRFLVQPDDFEFEELVINSSLPSFATDKTSLSGARKNFVLVPISDPEASVDFYIAERQTKQILH